MKIKINGNIEEINKMSIQDYLIEKKLDLKSVIIEYNFEILKKESWENTELKEEDNLEILSFVGGG